MLGRSRWLVGSSCKCGGQSLELSSSSSQRDTEQRYAELPGLQSGKEVIHFVCLVGLGMKKHLLKTS